MKIETNAADRKLLAQAIGEWIHEPVHYDGVPKCTYSVGTVTIERNGSISCEDEEVWAELTPFFRNHGWMPEEDSEAETKGTIGPDPERVDDSEAEAITGTCVSVPFGDATAANLINLLRTLYARQKLINAMTRGDTLFIDEEVITLLSDTKPDTREKISELLDGEIRAGMVRGVSFADGRISIEFPHSEENPTRWQHYANLLIAIVKRAFEAHHVSAALLEPKETEMKYFCNSWLMQLGFGGHDNKEIRAVLMGHLKGFAAFRTADKMDAHKAKLAERRHTARENTEVNANEADR